MGAGTLCVTPVDLSPSVGSDSVCVLQPVRISASAASAASSGLGADLSDTGLICSFTGSISRAPRTGGSTRAGLGNRQKPGCPQGWEARARGTFQKLGESGQGQTQDRWVPAEPSVLESDRSAGV